ncbi:hypothetical protein BTHE68_08870 [Burkholderia sp. THE68]|nr:hypothetical protein BTHE68_08870 [Burkholderia sp. THE68]
MTDQPAAARAETASEREADFRELRGLARAGFAADDHDLVRRDRPRDFLATAGNRKRFGEGDRRNGIRRDDAWRARLAWFTWFARLAWFGRAFASLFDDRSRWPRRIRLAGFDRTVLRCALDARRTISLLAPDLIAFRAR